MTTAEVTAVDKFNDNDFHLLAFKPIFNTAGERAGCELKMHSTHKTLSDVVNWVCERATNDIWAASQLFIRGSFRIDNNEWIFRIVYDINLEIDWDNQ